MRTLDTTEYHLEDRARRIRGKQATTVWAQFMVILFLGGCLVCGAIALALLRIGGCL